MDEFVIQIIFPKPISKQNQKKKTKSFFRSKENELPNYLPQPQRGTPPKSVFSRKRISLFFQSLPQIFRWAPVCVPTAVSPSLRFQTQPAGIHLSIYITKTISQHRRLRLQPTKLKTAENHSNQAMRSNIIFSQEKTTFWTGSYCAQLPDGSDRRLLPSVGGISIIVLKRRVFLRTEVVTRWPIAPQIPQK